MLNIKDLSQPDALTRENYEQASKLGIETFQRKDPGRLATLAGGRFEDGVVIVPHLNVEIVLDSKTLSFTVGRHGREAPIWLAILTVHYLCAAVGRPPTGKLTHFREFKEGHFYEPAFNLKSKDILKGVFGDDPTAMLKAGLKLAGKQVEGGDAAVELPYFPCLPITCIMWAGDEEFPPEAAVLFDETAELYLCAEDLAVAGQMAVLELLKASKG
jgi:hypothetical protein